MLTTIFFSSRGLDFSRRYFQAGWGCEVRHDNLAVSFSNPRKERASESREVSWQARARVFVVVVVFVAPSQSSRLTVGRALEGACEGKPNNDDDGEEGGIPPRSIRQPRVPVFSLWHLTPSPRPPPPEKSSVQAVAHEHTHASTRTSTRLNKQAP